MYRRQHIPVSPGIFLSHSHFKSQTGTNKSLWGGRGETNKSAGFDSMDWTNTKYHYQSRKQTSSKRKHQCQLIIIKKICTVFIVYVKGWWNFTDAVNRSQCRVLFVFTATNAKLILAVAGFNSAKWIAPTAIKLAMKLERAVTYGWLHSALCYCVF